MSLAADGTALKPGLQFDARRKCIFGMVNNISLAYIKANPIPNPDEIKKNLVTGADVMCITALDNGVSTNETCSNLQEALKTIQICASCLSQQKATQHIVDRKTLVVKVFVNSVGKKGGLPRMYRARPNNPCSFFKGL